MRRQLISGKQAFYSILIAVLALSACTQNSDNNLANVDDNGGYASDLSRIELVNEDVISIADIAGNTYNGAFLRDARITYLGTCATVGTDTLSDPHTLTIRFGDVDCVCLDGRKRQGTITVSYSGHYTDTAQLHTITYSNYQIDDMELTGSVQTTRIDTTITGSWYYKVYVNDSLNMSQDPLKSQYVIWTASLVHKWIAGFEAGDRNSEVYSISGGGLLTRPNHHAFSVSISSPLQFAINCRYCEAGVADITGANGGRVVNYGTAGSCDPNAQLLIGANYYPLVLTQ